jgi:hypothetical protein
VARLTRDFDLNATNGVNGIRQTQRPR